MSARLTFAEARSKIEAVLVEKGKHIDGGLVILDEMTIQTRYGWVFVYDSRRHVETGDILDAIGGNGPLVILAATGEVVALGTARTPDEEIARFEEARSLGARR